MICMSLDMICISKRAINFHPSISIKANGITSHYSGQPRTVTSSCKYAAQKKDEKLTIFDQIILRFNNYNLLLPVSLVIIIIIIIIINASKQAITAPIK